MKNNEIQQLGEFSERSIWWIRPLLDVACLIEKCNCRQWKNQQQGFCQSPCSLERILPSARWFHQHRSSLYTLVLVAVKGHFTRMCTLYIVRWPESTVKMHHKKKRFHHLVFIMLVVAIFTHAICFWACFIPIHFVPFCFMPFSLVLLLG